MRRPLVGVTPLYDEARKSDWMLPGYLEGVMEAGGLPVMLPLTADLELLEQLAETVDGVLLTGGHDVSPALYGQSPLSACGTCCPARDEMERLLLPLLWAQDKPILGICRGIQFLNVALGGTLYQDLPSQHPSAVEHHQRPPYDRPVHTVTLAPHSPLGALLSQETITVNSYHHQAIQTLSPALRPMAWSPDGLIEAVWAPERRWVWAVQWHPEFAFRTDANSRAIFRRFVEAMHQER